MTRLEKLRAASKKAQDAVADYKKSIGEDPMTKDQLVEYKRLIAVAKGINEEIEVEEENDREEAKLAAKAGQSPDRTGSTLPAEPKDKSTKHFKTFGEQLLAVAQVGLIKDHQGVSDSRLVYGKAAGANETIASEGGFLVEEDFSLQLLKLVHEQANLLARTTQIPISSNSNALRMPVIDETSRARGSRWGGIRAYWLAEGEQKIDSKPKFGEISLGLNKIAALGYVTDELLQDAAAMDTIFKKAFSEEIAFEVDDAIINGNGVGKPLGILKSGALITVSKETSQAADTVNFTNLVKMIERLPIRSRRNAVWLTNDGGVETALYNITLPGGAGYPIYLPPGQNTATPGNAQFGTLLGKPVIPTEFLPGLGDLGDLMLVDLSEYITITKGGIQAAESMHVRFVYDETCFRMVYRVDGKPAWRQPITNANGVMTKSPFVALQAR